MRFVFKYPGAAIILLLILGYALIAAPAYAAHPLITDDTGTQGKGKFLFEFNGQMAYENETSAENGGASGTAKEREIEMKAALTYGVVDSVDVILTAPYIWKKTEVNDATISDVNGIADVFLEVKWRFFERDGLSFAVKPGLTLPTGDKDKDLGAGRVGGTLYFITTKEAGPWAFHLNLGYKRNENQVDEREDIWHASLAGEYRIVKNLKLVADTGLERNTDKTSSINPAFLLGGFIYSVRENFDIDLGIKAGLNDAEVRIAYLAGIALRF
ncbi:MAG TPA: transporter [Syntrophales bacterium]|nr:transporter [Syntrophales bacterium]